MATPKNKLELVAQAKKEIEKRRIRLELPHLFGFPPYRWTKEYWESTNRIKVICAGNQISKSSSQVRHCIDLMTDKAKWKRYFPKWAQENGGVAPVAWYIYPNKSKIMEEWDKWEREFLPRGTMKADPSYGWRLERDKEGIPMCLRWNSGAVTWFKTWFQDLQAGTLAALFIDEECPFDLWPELAMRVTRYDGMISMVFTATLNQPFFYDVIERRGEPDEQLPNAAKWQISMEYDCQFYADGTPSPWTPEEVAKQKAKCGTDDEINRRIHGRFVSSKGRKYPSFSRHANIKPKKPIDPTWDYYAGVDIGTGGEEAHPAAVAIVGVRPDYKYARLVRLWCGNTSETTNTTQILNKYLELSRDIPITKAFYDYSSGEFKLRAQDAGVPFEKAEKGQEFGTDLLNTLFKNQMFDLDEQDEVFNAATEFENLRKDTDKRKAKDDRIDAIRYALSKVPFDLSGITGAVAFYEFQEAPKKRTIDDDRREAIERAEARERGDDQWSFEDEISFYNDLLD